MTATAIQNAIGTRRLRFNDEAELHEALALIFTETGMEFRREVPLSRSDRIDFLMGDLGLEVKVKESFAAILRQLKRYSDSPEIKELVLLCPRNHRLPETLGGKPLTCIPIWRNLL